MTDQRNVPTYSKANNRITSVGGQSYSYDYNGNITSTGTGSGTTAYTWDAEGRMVEQNRNGSYTQFVYDPMGDKLGKMSGQALSAARVPLPGGGVAIYSSSSDVDRYWHSDWQGSVRFVSSQGRALDYDNAKAPYGEEYAATGPTPTGVFAGLVGDTGGGSPLWDATFREYDHTQGRWLSPDPAGLAAADPTNPQSWNRYAYVGNNPASLIDPLGLQGGDINDAVGSCGNDLEHPGSPLPPIECGPLPFPVGFPRPIWAGGREGGAAGVGSSGSGTTTSGSASRPSSSFLNGDFGPIQPLGACQLFGQPSVQLGFDFGTCVPIEDPYTGQVGVSIGWTFPWGINISLFAGFAIDLHGHVAFYHGRGIGAAVGARASGGVQIGYSNADTVCGLAGPFANASGTLGVEGAAGTVDVFQGPGNGPGGVVTGGGVTVGVGGGGSASIGGTATTVVPVGNYRCP